MSRPGGVYLLSEVTRAIERVESVGPCSEQPNLGAEGLACLAVERGEQIGLSRPEAVVEGREELGAELRGDDSASSPVGRIGAALDQASRFEVIEEVGHDRSVDSEVLGQGELATNSALGGGGKDLVAARAAGQVGHRGARGRGVGPKDRAQAPSKIVCQRVVATEGGRNCVAVTGAVHHPIIADKALLSRSSVIMMICL
jgi:hypothetical protein